MVLVGLDGEASPGRSPLLSWGIRHAANRGKQTAEHLKDHGSNLRS